MERAQAADGSWTPLWFGDQDAVDKRSPVYGTAVAVDYLSGFKNRLAQQMTEKGVTFLVSVQNPDGGWGGNKGVPSKATLTARALSALAAGREAWKDPVSAGVEFLYSRFTAGRMNDPEPIGLYFARLWYSEELYNLTFTLTALKNIQKNCNL
ncbi:MAG: hypothetical protein LUD15_05000 [Bacteroides sp.]|nr:hypothetical protein [Bacteroides sp.]